MAFTNGKEPLTRRELPPSRFQRTIVDKANDSLTILSATSGGVRLGPNTPNGKSIPGYRGGVSIFTEILSLNVPDDGSAAFSSEGRPLRISCGHLNVFSLKSRGVISARGADGTTASKNGATASSIEIYVESMSKPLARTIELDAQGGKGANLPAQSKEAGGNGGNGGTIMAIWKLDLYKIPTILLDLKRQLSMPQKWGEEEELEADTIADGHWAIKALSDTLQDIKRMYSSRLDEILPYLKPIEDIVQLPIAEGTSPRDPETNIPLRSVYRLTAAINKSITMFKGTITDIRIDLTNHSLVKGGVAGKRSDMGLDLGALGSDGTPGTAKVELLGPTAQMNVFQVPFVFAHPLQCKMVFEKAQTYFYLGSALNREKARQLLETLIDRLSFATADFVKAFDAGIDSQPLLKAYVQFCGTLQKAQETAAELRVLYQKSVNLYVQLTSTTVDYYGYPEDWVPRTSFDAFSKMINDALTELQSTEKIYLDYLNASEGKNKLDVFVTQASGQIETTIQDSRRDLDQLSRLMTEKYKLISNNSRKEAITAAKVKAEKALKSLEGSISGHFEISPKSMLNGLVNFASGPSSALAAAQGASLLYEGFTSVPNISGDPISKDLLIKSLKKGGDNVGSLKQEMLSLDESSDGSLSVTNEFSTKVLTTLQNVENLIDEFADDTFGPSGGAAKTSLKEYSQLLVSRNNDMVEYNVMLKTAIAAQGEIAQMDKTRVQMKQERLNSEMNTAEDLDYMTTMLEKMFDNHRARVMKLMSFLQRSLKYKTLSQVDFLDNAWNEESRSQPAMEEAALSMTSQVLRGMKDRLFDQLFQVQEHRSSDKSLFPSNFESGGLGKIYHLSKGELATLLENGTAQINIPFVDADADQQYERQSEFRGCADVRIYRIRFWMRGLKLHGSSQSLGPQSVPRTSHSDKLFGGGKVVTAKLKHSGYETVVSPDNQKLTFRHEPISVTFSYRLYPDSTYEIGDATSGDIVNFSSSTRGVNSVYSAPSPYTWWTISLVNLNVDDIDVSGIEGAVIEFFGSYRSFENDE